MKTIPGGVCAAKGFTAAGVHCGIRKNKVKKDLALILSDRPAAAACVYTTNLVQGAPIAVTRAMCRMGMPGPFCATAATPTPATPTGWRSRRPCAGLLAAECGIQPTDVIIGSTGVIGQPLPLAPIQAGMPALVQALGDHSDDAAEAIMTTDLKKKELAVAFEVEGKTCHLGASPRAAA